MRREAEIYAARSQRGTACRCPNIPHRAPQPLGRAHRRTRPAWARFGGLGPWRAGGDPQRAGALVARAPPRASATLPLPTLPPAAERRRSCEGGPLEPEWPGGALPSAAASPGCGRTSPRRRPTVAGAGRRRPGDFPPRRRAPLTALLDFGTRPPGPPPWRSWRGSGTRNAQEPVPGLGRAARRLRHPAGGVIEPGPGSATTSCSPTPRFAVLAIERAGHPVCWPTPTSAAASSTARCHTQLTAEALTAATATPLPADARRPDRRQRGHSLL